MHELAVAENILEIALRHAEMQQAKKITRLNIVVGEWSSIVDDSIQFYWDIISEDSIARGGRLNFTRLPVQIVCQDCSFEYHPDYKDLLCPKCGGVRLQVKTGEEFYLDSIEIES